MVHLDTAAVTSSDAAICRSARKVWLPAMQVRHGRQATIHGHLRRNRRAFAVDLMCQGASSTAKSGVIRERESKDADLVAADIFSSIIRQYSSGGHLPFAIIRLRWPT